MVGFVKSPILVTIGYSIASMYVFSLKYILSATKNLVQEDLELTDTEAGLIYTVFVIATMISCPVMGYIADMATFYKKYIALAGLIIDASAVIILSFCNNFYVLLIPRIISGLGDGAFSTIAPPILSEYFPPQKRNMVLTIFLSISNVGAAVGFSFSSILAEAFTWRIACIMMGLPGFLGFLLLIFRDPEALILQKEQAKIQMSQLYESKQDEDQISMETTKKLPTEKSGDDVTDDAMEHDEGTGLMTGAPAAEPMWKSMLAGLMRIFSAPYTVSVTGFMFIGFAMAGLADWGTSFFVRYYDMTTSTAGTVCGLMTVICALVGTMLGGIICEYVGKVLKRHPQLFVASITLLIGATINVVAIFFESVVLCCMCFGLAFILCYIYYGPMNAYIINSVPKELRSRATGIMYFCRHLGGSFASSVVGAISDASHNDLRTALIVSPLANMTAGFIWACAFVAIPGDAEKLLASEGTVDVAPVETVEVVVGEEAVGPKGEGNGNLTGDGEGGSDEKKLKHDEKTPLRKEPQDEPASGIILDK